MPSLTPSMLSDLKIATSTIKVINDSPNSEPAKVSKPGSSISPIRAPEPYLYRKHFMQGQASNSINDED